ncbi:SDR family oxidoreductase [Phytomonospora sp. NPDC050363]|uniref:SDR family oxidoreductase n=1 Tax=Phytomonospora sp. NPDC050363 TaxID=3155642 RepID=UPI003404DC0B
MTGTVLITGASSGIGMETAVRAALAGHTVVATMRDTGRSEELRKTAAEAGATVDVRALDVTDPDSIEACVSEAVEAHGGIDVVVNNAGAASTLPTVEVCPMDRYRAGFEVNFFGVVNVTKAVMPHLRASRGRLITVGSTRGLIAQPFNECYSASKFAVEGFMESLAPTAAAVGVDVVIVEPGPVLGTAFAANSGATRDSLLAMAGPYTDVLTSYLDWFASNGFPGAKTAGELAETLVETMTADDPPFRVLAGEWAAEFAARKLTEPEGRAILAMTSAWVRNEAAGR